jgi:hypothetical protein
MLLRKAYCVQLLWPEYKIVFEILIYDIVLYSLIKQK